MAINLLRREIILALGGMTAAWPLASHGRQLERMRRIGVLINFRSDDPEGQARLTAFRQALRELGWIDGDDVRMDAIRPHGRGQFVR
jgi:putative tryptophan/tyrosine transport system substrate-binding protein